MVKKIIAGLVILITLVQVFSPFAFALELNDADIVFTGRKVVGHLLFKRDNGTIGGVTCSIVGHYVGNKFYPAYCMNVNLDGVEKGSYDINISDYINNEKIWRVVTHGFPYNNLGLSDDDAFLVTKMAVYCVSGNSYLGKYTYDKNNPITVQTYNALKYLVETVAEDQNIKKQTGTISIKKDGDLIENRKLLFSRVFCKFYFRGKKL